jgi:hypothetical protein
MLVKSEKPPDVPISYRIISLLPYLSKICEKLILKLLSPHIFATNILLDSQFGFRARHIMVYQAYRVVDAISTFLEKKYYCTAVFSDITQSFDQVWHKDLLFKLPKFLPSSFFLLIKYYLKNHHFQICCESSTSVLIYSLI